MNELALDNPHTSLQDDIRNHALPTTIEEAHILMRDYCVPQGSVPGSKPLTGHNQERQEFPPQEEGYFQFPAVNTGIYETKITGSGKSRRRARGSSSLTANDLAPVGCCQRPGPYQCKEQVNQSKEQVNQSKEQCKEQVNQASSSSRSPLQDNKTSMADRTFIKVTFSCYLFSEV